MHTINSSWQIGNLQLPHRLIQGPLAGYSCAPFRSLFYQFTAPAYCVSEMCSAIDVLHKHHKNARYLYRSPQEKTLAYQLSGVDPIQLADAAVLLQHEAADLIDINCGCPKPKIRKKGAGSALLEHPEHLALIIKTVRAAITIPLTVKIRIQGTEHDISLAQRIADAGADALIVHGRRWVDDYDIPCDFKQIAAIKRKLSIPVIANGDIGTLEQLNKAFDITHCDAYMIGRAGSGRPWLYQELLKQQTIELPVDEIKKLFIQHVHALAALENEFKAILQSKSLIRYYFKNRMSAPLLERYYTLRSLSEIEAFLFE